VLGRRWFRLRVGYCSGDYDPAGTGNATVVGSASLTYDAENRVVSDHDTTSGGTVTYAYDGLGQRVTRTTASGTTTYVYDAFGNLAAEYGTGSAPPPCITCYVSDDALGSTRMVANESGTVVALHDYYPFGYEVAASTAGRSADWGTADNIAQKFTGQERDTESGLDHFPARHYGMGMGRFLVPDPAGNQLADLTNPESWNMYSYTRNNPLAFIDPTGLCTVVNGVYVEDGGNACPAPPSSSVSVTSGGGGSTGPVVLAPGTCYQVIVDGFSNGVTCSGGNTGGTSAGAPPTTPAPPTTKTPSWWDCVRGDTDYFSFQNMVKSASGGKLGNRWLAGAFLGNSVQSVGDTVQAIGDLDFSRAGNVAGAEALGDTAGSIATTAASKVPNVAIAVGVQVAASIQTPVSSTSVSVVAQASARLPLGSIAQSGAGVLSKGLGILGLIKLPYDLTIASFSGVACGIGR
jgi:RHS repeat-associated protein